MPAGQTTLYLRGVPREIVRDAKVAAARQGTTLAAFVSEAVARAVGGELATSSLSEDRAWFETNRRKLCQRYDGQYVAVDGGRVIDHDRSFAALAARVFRAGGVRPVLMPKVSAAPPVVRLRSPRTRGE